MKSAETIQYLSAEALDIQPWERDGLIAFVEDAETMKHNPEPRITVKPGTKDIIFNMSVPVSAAECGTVCCIGGFVWMHKHGVSLERLVNTSVDRDASAYVYNREGPLQQLYFPSEFSGYWEAITPIQAAEVVKHFLTHGEVSWRKAE